MPKGFAPQYRYGRFFETVPEQMDGNILKRLDIGTLVLR